MFKAILTAALISVLPAVARAQPVPIIGLVELTGGGATVGTNFDNGVKLAVKEINAAGGLLGHQIAYTSYDTQTNPGVAKALARRAVDENAYIVLGPVYSGSIIVSATETRRAEIPNFVGGEAASFTLQGNPYIYRASLSQTDSMPRAAVFIKQQFDAKKVAVVFVNDDFGKGGRDLIQKALKDRGITDAADISTDLGQIDMSGIVLKAKQSAADVLFIYMHEEESARLLRELRKQGYDKPIVGETTLTNEKVIELAGDAANGIMAHVGLLADAPDATIQDFTRKFKAAYGYVPDHNAMKGYIAINVAAAETTMIGKIDRAALAKAMHGAKISAKEFPGVLLDVQYDEKGDIDRQTFIVKVENGKQVVMKTLPLGVAKQ